MSIYIYTLTDPTTNEVRYVGKTNNPDVRLAGHLTSLDNEDKRVWLQSLLAKGYKPIMDIIEIHEDDASASTAENKWIVTYRDEGNRLTNISRYGKARSGKPRNRMLPFSVTPEDEEWLLALPNRSEWLRERIAEAQRKKKESDENQQEIR